MPILRIYQARAGLPCIGSFVWRRNRHSAMVKALFLVHFQKLTIVVLLQKLQPVFAITLATFLLKEKLRPGFFIWATIAIVDGYFLTFGFQHT
jgi:drug/metabolite transporter (DMT)-like permease